MEGADRKTRESLQKQLNRIVMLLRTGMSPSEELQLCKVMQSLFKFSDSRKLAVRLEIKERCCEICSGEMCDENFETSGMETFTFKCGHKICSPDCFGEYLIRIGKLEDRVKCPRRECEVKTLKSDLELKVEESEYKNIEICCGICFGNVNVENRTKLECFHGFCNMCLVNDVKEKIGIGIGYQCSLCGKVVKNEVVTKVLNPVFELRIRESLRFFD